jgi:hypothetical protein
MISQPAVVPAGSVVSPSMPRAIRIGSTALSSESSTIISATKLIAPRCGRK